MAGWVAVLGTGIMGAPVARNLLQAGFQVRVWNRTLVSNAEARESDPQEPVAKRIRSGERSKPLKRREVDLQGERAGRCGAGLTQAKP